MDPTPLTFIVIPISVLILLADDRWVIGWLILIAPLQAASVADITVGDSVFGVQPALLAGALFMGKQCSIAVVRGFVVRYQHRILWLYRPLTVFVILTVVSAIVLPFIFAGTLVNNPRISGGAVPLRPNAMNLTQGFYLIFYALLSCVIAHHVSAKGARTVIRAYFAAGAMVIILGLYQFVSWYMGLPYPYELIHSNPSYIHHGTAMIGGVKRVSATFAEPSFAAFWLCGFFAFATVYVFRSKDVIATALSVLALLTLLLTTSSTAYAVLLVLVALGLWRIGGKIATFKTFTEAQVLWTTGIAGFGAVALLVFVFTGDIRSIESLLGESVIDKASSISAAQRLGSDLTAVQVFLDTRGFGAGWGSNRASSMGLTILSAVGLWGIALLAWFFVRLRRAYRTVAGKPIDAFAFSVIASLLAGLVAVPDTSRMTLWIMLGVTVGLIDRETVARGTR